MAVVRVALDERSYPIRIGSGLLDGLGAACRKLHPGGPCALISDRTVAGLYGAAALNSLRAAGFDPFLITFAAGESAKRMKTVEDCYDALARRRLERRSLVVALGGGVVGDLAGFVAATYLRGVGFVQAPTTLLAQVDSSVGGKVGVNLPQGKNLVGAFYQPRLVLCDLATLRTLPERELRAGLAEVIKYGAIRDGRLFRKLEGDLPQLLKLNPGSLSAVIARCCAIKAEVVGQDETESGLRAILNFGHTIGHAIEATTGYGRFLHGEAISIGMVAAARISCWLLALPEGEVERLTGLLKRAGLPVSFPHNATRRRQIMAAMRLDKKVAAGQVKFVLLRRIGSAVWGQKVPEQLLERSLDSLGGE